LLKRKTLGFGHQEITVHKLRRALVYVSCIERNK
jgi:hypothetical protein